VADTVAAGITAEAVGVTVLEAVALSVEVRVTLGVSLLGAVPVGSGAPIADSSVRVVAPGEGVAELVARLAVALGVAVAVQSGDPVGVGVSAGCSSRGSS
jgi:hypothetical protein